MKYSGAQDSPEPRLAIWIAPSEKDDNYAGNQFRANSGLKVQQHSERGPGKTSMAPPIKTIVPPMSAMKDFFMPRAPS